MSVTVVPDAAARTDAAVTRVSFRFDTTGTYAACLASDGRHGLYVEAWSLAGERVSHLRLSTPGSETARTQPVPTADGRVVVCRNGTGLHRVSLLDHAGEEIALGSVAGPGLRLIPCPPAAGWALGVSVGADGATTLRRVDQAGMTTVATLPGVFAGGSWLDEQGRSLAGTLLRGRSATPVRIDLAEGRWTPLPGVEPAGATHLLLTGPRTGLMLAAHTGGSPTLLWSPGGGAELRPARGLPDGGRLLPLTVDPDGQRVAVRISAGAASRLATYDPAAGVVEHLQTPAGTLQPVAGWNHAGLHVPLSRPHAPVGILTVTARGCRVTGSAPAPHPDGWVPAHLEHLPGAAGPVEAIVYGDWRTAARLVVALHGGPEAAWSFEFDPLLQQLADAGMAVVAPNQRGSTGYGAAHRDALLRAWGGPDLADVAAISEYLAAGRGPAAPRPALYGISYGAYLALLASATQPDRWSRCAVVAPFLSGARLHASASPAVQRLLDRLGGCVDIDDPLGPRDVWRLAPRLRAPLLVVHGDADDVVPVTQSQQLVRRLTTLGHPVEYREVAGGGHDPLAGPGGDDLAARISAFLRAEPHQPDERR
ncbi:alpha/beta hydrolase family protein [Micromonospora echinofusca]|uniref:Dipeptidyl aminopeptidase/acylaminoacyl peptidase n=1 Tax=Micromonospora echinofusca TaxID=47858 RepID=A0A1C5G7F0_MICEH|nr:alpha/beta fold hydrolase [Micromonospora echinofusca]SCG15650.1 Dipeptidyl aminopeptidase/acylaminoacyl peptidase [Micromonospora echinofusca]